jgi:PHD/YefM family antitoxin component YafN of YafNO toxin-antitoxin module
MKHYTYSYLNKAWSKVIAEALKAPIALTKYGKPTLVILPADEFSRLTRRGTAAHIIENELANGSSELTEGPERVLPDRRRKNGTSSRREKSSCSPRTRT